MKPVPKRILVAVVATALVLVSGARPAHASTLTLYYQNLATLRCLDDSSAYGLRGFPCQQNSYQTWFRTQKENTWYELKNATTGWCLDDSTSSLSHEYANDVLRAIPCNGLNYQRWREISLSIGKEFQNVATGRCLDDSTAYGNDVLRAYDCLGNDYQAWIPY